MTTGHSNLDNISRPLISSVTDTPHTSHLSPHSSLGCTARSTEREQLWVNKWSAGLLFLCLLCSAACGAWCVVCGVSYLRSGLLLSIWAACTGWTVLYTTVHHRPVWPKLTARSFSCTTPGDQSGLNRFINIIFLVSDPPSPLSTLVREVAYEKVLREMIRNLGLAEISIVFITDPTGHSLFSSFFSLHTTRLGNKWKFYGQF